jgi:tRNA 2-thiouridine synthesizing protein A
VTSPGCLDLREQACPMTWVRTRIALERLAPGDRLEIWLAGQEPVDTVARTAVEEGHLVVALGPLAGGAASERRLVLAKGTAQARLALP